MSLLIRAAAAMQSARRRRRLAGPILDYSLATFARASEASLADPRAGYAFDLVTPWPSTDVARIFADGAILIEGSRTNLQPGSEDLSTWTQNNSPTITGGQVAPDGAFDAYRITDPGSSYTGVTQNVAIGSAGTLCFRAWVRKDSDTSRFPEFQLVQASSGGLSTPQLNTSTGAYSLRSGNTWTNVSAQVGSVGDWWRLDVRFTTASSANIGTTFYPAVSTVWNSASAAATGSATAWGFEYQRGLFLSSPIRTSGSAATRAGEVCTFAAASVPAALRTGRWTLSVWPEYADDDAPSLAHLLYFDADNYLALVNGQTLRLRANGVDHDVDSLDYAAHDELAIEVVHGDTLTVTGGGGGSVALTETWAGTSAVDLVVGSDGSANHAYAVIGRPVAA